MRLSANQVSTYALVRTKNGHQLRVSATAESKGARPAQGSKPCSIGEHAAMDQLALFRSAPLGFAVQDKTGLRVNHIENLPTGN